MPSSEVLSTMEGVVVASIDEPNIVTRLAAVMGEMPAIGKDQEMKDGPRYKYRGIEQIMPEIKRLFSKHGVVATPNVLDTKVSSFEINNRPWTDTTLTIRYDFWAPDLSYISATTVGVGRDNSDKGANKAMTAAYKYALMQVLNISDFEEGDAERTETPSIWEQLGWVDAQAHTAARAQVTGLAEKLSTGGRSAVIAQWNDHGFKWPLSRGQLDEWKGIVEAELRKEVPPNDDGGGTLPGSS